MIIALTKKLAEKAKIQLDAPPDILNPFYSWHAKSFLYKGRNGMILINDKTYYSITLWGLKSVHFKKLDVVVKEAISETFLYEGFSDETVTGYIEQCGNVAYTKTYSRKIIGILNSFELPITYALYDHMENRNVNIIEINKSMGRFLCGGPNYVNPIEQLRKEMNYD